MICFYHRGDLDGHCAGAIVRSKFVNPHMVGIDYEDDFPWHIVEPKQTIVMVDFSLPMEDMARLKELAQPLEFIWIDHHQTALSQAQEAGFETPGLQRVDLAACELAWRYFFSKTDMPLAVFLLGRYDVFDEDIPNWKEQVLPFQFGMRAEITDPCLQDSQYLWDILLDSPRKAWVELGVLWTRIIDTGEKILSYQRQSDAKLMARHAYQTIFHGHRAIFINHGPGGSMKFEAHPLAKEIPLLVSYARLPAEKWLVNLYTFRDDVDCGEIARAHGGGGHRKAAGFICEELPFEILRGVSRMEPGTLVVVWRDNGQALLTRTRGYVQVRGGQSVVWVHGIAGCYALTHVRPIIFDPSAGVKISETDLAP